MSRRRCCCCGKPGARVLIDGMCSECADEYYALAELRRERRPSRLAALLRRILKHGDPR